MPRKILQLREGRRRRGRPALHCQSLPLPLMGVYEYISMEAYPSCEKLHSASAALSQHLQPLPALRFLQQQKRRHQQAVARWPIQT
jgi:hypothetical protein